MNCGRQSARHAAHKLKEPSPSEVALRGPSLPGFYSQQGSPWLKRS